MRKRIIISLCGMTITVGLWAQAKTIESPIITEKDFVWYVEQKNTWKDIVEKEPQNETAWLNYYLASRYMMWWDNDNQNDNRTAAQQIIREMQQAIPNSYTFNHCAYKALIAGHGIGQPEDADQYAETALSMLPDNMQFYDYDTWISYLAMKGHEERMAQLAKRYFDSGIYSETVLRYNYNELSGMDEGGIIFANGDAALIPKWIIQYGMNKHSDKTVVCIPFLAVKEYRQWLSKHLSVVLPSPEEHSFSSYQEYECALIQAIINKYPSKVYFSSTTTSEILQPWEQHLYNEGLTLKYSNKAYDNMAVKRRNVEKRYLLEYLLVSFRPDWTAGQRLSANYAIVLADILPYYAKHDKQRYDWLIDRLISGVTNTSLSEERKQQILRLLTSYN